MSIDRMLVATSAFNTANLLAGYQLATPAAGFPGACSILRIVNSSASFVTISYDGVNTHDGVIANNDMTIYFEGSSSPPNKVSKLPRGTKVYVASAAANAGQLLVVCYYQPGY